MSSLRQGKVDKVKRKAAKDYHESIDTLSVYDFEQVKSTEDLSYLIIGDKEIDQSILVEAWSNIIDEIIQHRLDHDKEYRNEWEKRKKRALRYAKAVLNHDAVALFHLEREYADLKKKEESEDVSFWDVLTTLEDIKGRSIDERTTTVRKWLVMVYNAKKNG